MSLKMLKSFPANWGQIAFLILTFPEIIPTLIFAFVTFGYHLFNSWIYTTSSASSRIKLWFDLFMALFEPDINTGDPSEVGHLSVQMGKHPRCTEDTFEVWSLRPPLRWSKCINMVYIHTITFQWRLRHRGKDPNSKRLWVSKSVFPKKSLILPIQI